MIKLNNGTVLFLREINRYLALVCVIRESNYDKHGLVNYNVRCLKKAVEEIFKPGGGSSAAAASMAAASAGAH